MCFDSPFMHRSRMSFDSFFMQRSRGCLSILSSSCKDVENVFFSEFFLQAKIENVFRSFFFSCNKDWADVVGSLYLPAIVMLKPRPSIVVELRIQSMSWREMIISREKVIQAPAAPVEDIPVRAPQADTTAQRSWRRMVSTVVVGRHHIFLSIFTSPPVSPDA
jgi:hypothetical protein